MAIKEVNPWVFNALRLVFATATLGVLTWIESRIRPFPNASTRNSYVFLFAMLTGSFYLLFFVRGISLTLRQHRLDYVSDADVDGVDLLSFRQ